jgi:two-component system, LytTR family, response regulator
MLWHRHCFWLLRRKGQVAITQPYQANFLPIRCNGRIVILKAEDIGWVEAARNSVKIHHGAESILLKSSLEKILNELGNGIFVRIHRCTIVNLLHIRELRHWLRGSYQILLNDGTQLMLSRTYRNHLFEILGKPLG